MNDSCAQPDAAGTGTDGSLSSSQVGSPVTELPTCELDSEPDPEAEAMLRAIAHAPPRRPRSAVVPGTRWGNDGRYVIERRLGRGGMGTVYAATDTFLRRVVALKVLDAATSDHDTVHHSPLLREAQFAARVEHERIARVYDVGSHEGFDFVAMEHVSGGTLRQRMAEHDTSLPRVVDIATQIAEGLAELHGKGMIHRDLKPENVMLTAQGGVKLLDFGLARYTVVPVDEPGAPAWPPIFTGASVGAASGTPGYMAPEQCLGHPIDARVDIFALGVIIHELVTGERLFHGATAGAIMRATLERLPELHGDAWANAPELLRDHTARMLARDPAARFADGSHVLAALRELNFEMASQPSLLPATAPGSPSKPPPPHAFSLRPPERMRRRFAAKPLALASMVAVAIALEIAPPPHPAPVPPPPSMVRIDVGTIDVGRDRDEIDRECGEIGAGCDRTQMLREVPRTRVTVPPFFLDKNEVTNEEFAAMLNSFAGSAVEVTSEEFAAMLNHFGGNFGSLGSFIVRDDKDDHYPRYVLRNVGTADTPDPIKLSDLSKKGCIEYSDRRTFRVRAGCEKLPVSVVSWYGAELFCETHGKRLPTEDEWEAAARGREDRRFPWGNELPRCGNVVIPNDGKIPMLAPGWSPCAEGDVRQRAVASAAQDVTPDGIRDLGGNVAEWTSSLFIEDNRAAHPEGAPRDAPRVIRGGSWALSLLARSSGRSGHPPDTTAQNIGFRCALNGEAARP